MRIAGTILSITINSDSLFDRINRETYRASQELRDKDGKANPDQYGWSVDERPDYEIQLTNAFVKVCDAVQRWAPLESDNTNLMDVSSGNTTINLKWGPEVKVPDTQVEHAIISYLESILLTWWWTTKNVPIAALWESKELESRQTLRSRLFSRNTGQIKYRPY